MAWRDPIGVNSNDKMRWANRRAIHIHKFNVFYAPLIVTSLLFISPLKWNIFSSDNGNVVINSIKNIISSDESIINKSSVLPLIFSKILSNKKVKFILWIIIPISISIFLRSAGLYDGIINSSIITANNLIVFCIVWNLLFIIYALTELVILLLFDTGYLSLDYWINKKLPSFLKRKLIMFKEDLESENKKIFIQIYIKDVYTYVIMLILLIIIIMSYIIFF